MFAFTRSVSVFGAVLSPLSSLQLCVFCALDLVGLGASCGAEPSVSAICSVGSSDTLPLRKGSVLVSSLSRPATLTSSDCSS